MQLENKRRNRPSQTTRPSLWLAAGLIIAVAVLGVLSLRQYKQLQQLKQLSRQKTHEQARTTTQLVDQLVSLAGNFDQRIEQEIAQQWENTTQQQKDRGQQKLLQVQDSLQELAAKVLQLSNHMRDGENEQIPDELLERLSELSTRIEQSQRQMTDLVRRYRWAENIVAELSGGVCLIQGEYIFVNPATDLPLRYNDSLSDAVADQTDDSKKKTEMFRPVSVTGKGETLKVAFTATGFLADQKGFILTNKHVTTPWRVARDYQHVLEAGYQGRLSMLRAFFANQPDPFDLKLVTQSETEDVAVLSCDIGPANIPALPCLENPDQLRAGQRVIILGYPTGFEALLARLGHDELDEIAGDKDIQIDQLALTLARRGLIQPIGTSGMCGRVSPDKIVYDAQTAIGGSGSPVLGSDGKVVGINTALLRGFSGTNFGIPIEVGLKLLEQVADQPDSLPKAAKKDDLPDR